MKYHVNTLDLDWVRLDNGFIMDSGALFNSVIRSICRCSSNVSVDRRRSASGNGWHVRLRCARGCDICRLVHDSAPRFDMDQHRPPHLRDVLWDRKSYSKGGKTIVMNAGEWDRV